MSSNIIEVATQPYPDQKPGTSGLRKKVTVFQQLNYTENFIQAILEATSRPKFLVVGGDGRFYSEEVIKKIVSICAANGVQKMYIGKDGILSTPAASAVIRANNADGGIILTASHNPGGPEGDFGIKYNTSNGGPAPEYVTNKIYEISKKITSYKSLLKRPQLDLTDYNNYTFGQLKVEIIDPVEDYLRLLRRVFDFEKLRELFRPSSIDNGKRVLNMRIDCMNGVTGPYARRVLCEELGAASTSVVNYIPLPDFGGKHPDPNLTYAADLVTALRTNRNLDFGVAFDGDGDRNMILGRDALFITPGDSVAVIGNLHHHIKYFKQHIFQGFARSFPTAPALDRVAQKYHSKCYETPTGWKYFGNLMDSGLISLCGEESFGTGSDHVREKDGLWACLAWMTVMAHTSKTVSELMDDHWNEFGRDYFSRLDYEECDATKCQTMMKDLETLLTGKSLIGQSLGDDSNKYLVKETGNFEYVDPVDRSVTSKQGLFIVFENGARIIFRLSGTGSSGATVRVYLSDYSKEKTKENSQVFLKTLKEIALSISKLVEHTGRSEPTVIT